jgi:hypothetical protein
VFFSYRHTGTVATASDWVESECGTIDCCQLSSTDDGKCNHSREKIIINNREEEEGRYF